MKKVGICGPFGFGNDLINGQTIKIKVLTTNLEKVYGDKNILKMDTYRWRDEILILLKKSFQLLKKSENIILLPSINGVKVLIPLFVILNFFFKRKIIYFVIGSRLAKSIKNKKILKYFLKKIDIIVVETRTQLKELEKIGINKNVIQINNYKDLQIINHEELVKYTNSPYKICTFSRVKKDKGIEDIIEVVIQINEKHKQDIYQLDIYGQIDNDYKERFNALINNSPHYIQYKGIVEYNETTSTLKKYFCLIFPTQYHDEGIPGTIIDAYSAGIPIVASKWDSAEEIIENNETGLLYSLGETDELKSVLEEISTSPQIINNMKNRCLEKANLYSPKTVIPKIQELIK